MSENPLPKTLHVFLVKPSKYDDDGYVVRHWRGVLPSNTLACLAGLTADVKDRRLLGEVDIEVHLVDEAVAKVPVARIARMDRRAGEKAVVALVGVQTNQFCRASDLALDLRRRGVTVLFGGFHVSGMLSLFAKTSPEIRGAHRRRGDGGRGRGRGALGGSSRLRVPRNAGIGRIAFSMTFPTSLRPLVPSSTRSI